MSVVHSMRMFLVHTFVFVWMFSILECMGVMETADSTWFWNPGTKSRNQVQIVGGRDGGELNFLYRRSRGTVSLLASQREGYIKGGD